GRFGSRVFLQEFADDLIQLSAIEQIAATQIPNEPLASAQFRGYHGESSGSGNNGEIMTLPSHIAPRLIGGVGLVPDWTGSRRNEASGLTLGYESGGVK